MFSENWGCIKMSCFIVGDVTINRFLTHIYYNVFYGHEHYFSHIRRQFEQLGFKLNNDKELKRLGDELFKLNYDSFNYNYSHHEKKAKYKGDFELKTVNENIFQVLKSLQCFLYQSCEGDCDQTELYKLLRDYEKAITWSIIDKNEKYTEAEWG